MTATTIVASEAQKQNKKSTSSNVCQMGKDKKKTQTESNVTLGIMQSIL